MFEERFKRPSAIEIEKSSLESMSILLIKPEVNLLESGERGKLIQLLESHFSVYGDPVCIFPLLLDKETARKLWQKDIGQFPWAESYYEHITSVSCVAIILSGRDSANILKKTIRMEMSPSIARMNETLGSKFILDIIHGSNPDDGLLELQTFIEVAERNSQLS